MYIFILVVEMETQVEKQMTKKGWVTILVRVETHEKLEKLRLDMKLKSFNEVITRLIDHYEKNK